MTKDCEKRLDEILDRLWTIWYSGALDAGEDQSLEDEIKALHEKTGNPRCLYALSELWHYRTIAAMRKTAEYALLAMEGCPSDPGIHDNHVFGKGMRFDDFAKIDHNGLIEFYDAFISKHPDCLIAYRLLVECLIDNDRLDEADEVITSAEGLPAQSRYLFDMYSGEVLWRRGERRKARECWEKTCRENPDNATCRFIEAEYLAKHAQYEPAVASYLRSFELQTTPRKVDALKAVYRIHEIRDDNAAALEVIAGLKRVYKDDWAVSEDDEELYGIGEDERRIAAKLSGSPS